MVRGRLFVEMRNIDRGSGRPLRFVCASPARSSSQRIPRWFPAQDSDEESTTSPYLHNR